MGTRNILIALGVLVIVGVGVFAFMRGDHPRENADSAAAVSTAPVSDYHDNVYQLRTSPNGTSYMTDFAGTALYTYDNDTSGVSTCNAACLKLWKPYTSGATAEGMLPRNISVITRSDGSQQFAWKGMPLYYYTGDATSGDTMGDNLNGVWHLVHL